MTRSAKNLLRWAALLFAMVLIVPNGRGVRGDDVIFRHAMPSGADLTDGRYGELKYSQGEWYGSTFFTGPDWTRVGKDWHHPGQDTPSVRCFTAPQDGEICVSGRVLKLHRSGDGIRAVIRHGDREVWKAEIEGDDGTGVAHDLTLNVRQGDRIRFVIHKRGGIACDTTGWDPSVRMPDGTTYQASKAFDEHKQGGGGWRYEMEVGPERESGFPVVSAWSKDLAIRLWTVRPDKAVELSGDDVLPLIVTADAKDRRGLALAAAPRRPWRFVASMDTTGEVRLTWHGEKGEDAPLWSKAYEGALAKGWMCVDRCLTEEQRFAELQDNLKARSPQDDMPLSLRAMVQADWRRQDAIDDSAACYALAARTQLERAKQLLDALQAAHGKNFLTEESQRLALLAESLATAEKLAGAGGDAETARTAWLQVRQWKRRIALANPLMDFGPLLVTKRVPPSWSHLVAQYFGWRQRPGGGLYVIEKPGRSLAVRDILGDQLPPGSVLEPRLRYDGGRILFAFVACNNDVPDPASLPVNEEGSADRYFHLFEIHADGSGLRQLTDGRYDDMMAEYLPDGDIVFCSTRRKGYSRCFGPEYSYRWHSYTLHRMNADGGDIRTLSYNDVSEWFPAVSNSGHVLHARWDYIDRDAVTHQNLWSIRPDGTNPVAVWGNATPKPHCAFQAKPIPASNKIVFIGSAHHSITAGPVCILDPTVDATSLDAVTRITPLPFPEAEGNLDEWYSSPWPLSEDYFLVAYSPYRLRFQGEHQTDPNPDNALGIYLLDAAGNRELLYRDPDIGTTNPTPLTPRPRPPVLPSAAFVAAKDTGTMVVTDVNQGLPDVPRGAIKELRIVQIFPKTTWLANQPRIGVAGEENGRAILGTVPVESDGSACFEVPAGKAILFQALDERGMAYQTMRSLTFVQPGEQTSCVGCHEHRMTSPPTPMQTPLALRRRPSTIEPGELGGRPFGFVEVVQPMLDRHCVRCHGGERKDGDLDLTAAAHQGFTRSYLALCGTPDAWKSQHFDPAAAESHLVPRFVQRNQIQVTPPGGTYGARGSRLMKLLLAGHEDAELSADELRRLAAWIDLNAIFYGVYDAEGQARQLAGERVAMPEIQ
ncbi:MAG: hypothetical protein GXY83_31525 [Rhodopirellula sp.]|nr:hypothetical protein [Rhodopirellula sp.]